jgi:ADP-dependent NAD(P)H-hydrate dehydratase
MSTPSDASGETVSPALLREWTLPEPGSSKHSRGHILVVGGARSTPGAVLLAGLAALRVGAGVLALAVEEPVATGLAVAVPEASVLGLAFHGSGLDGSDGVKSAADLAARIADADTVLLGPGLDDPQSTRRLLQALAEHSPPDLAVVLDAFALGVLADPTNPFAREALPLDLILTPNQDEAHRLLADEPKPVDFDDGATVAAVLAERYSAVVAYQRHVADPSGRGWFVPHGNAGLGTSGSGDVLAGAITGLLARGATTAQAACWATYLHAVAGDRLAARIGRLGFLAREVLDELPAILTELEVS